MAGGRVVTGLVLAAAAATAIVLFAPAVRRTLALGDRAQGSPITVVAGRGFTLELPKNRWYAARTLGFKLIDDGGQTDPDRPTLEHHLLRVGEPADLVVVAWSLPGNGSLDLDDAVARISERSSQSLPTWRLLGVAPLPGRGATRVLHATARLEGRDVEMLWGLFPTGQNIHGVLVSADQPAFAGLRREMEGILASFRGFDLPEPR